jgi:hypothetical protein
VLFGGQKDIPKEMAAQISSQALEKTPNLP